MDIFGNVCNKDEEKGTMKISIYWPSLGAYSNGLLCWEAVVPLPLGYVIRNSVDLSKNADGADHTSVTLHNAKY